VNLTAPSKSLKNQTNGSRAFRKWVKNMDDIKELGIRTSKNPSSYKERHDKKAIKWN